MTEQIDQFFNPDGTLITIPVKSAKKIAVLLHIARELSPTTKYPERELTLPSEVLSVHPFVKILHDFIFRDIARGVKQSFSLSQRAGIHPSCVK